MRQMSTICAAPTALKLFYADDYKYAAPNGAIPGKIGIAGKFEDAVSSEIHVSSDSAKKQFIQIVKEEKGK
jgi:hypothetical protein